MFLMCILTVKVNDNNFIRLILVDKVMITTGCSEAFVRSALQRKLNDEAKMKMKKV
jgi:hypothetical protein